MSISEIHQSVLHDIGLAARNGDLHLLQCKDKTTGDQITVLCLGTPSDDGTTPLNTMFMPLARLFDGEPLDEVIPPHAPEGNVH